MASAGSLLEAGNSNQTCRFRSKPGIPAGEPSWIAGIRCCTSGLQWEPPGRSLPSLRRPVLQDPGGCRMPGWEARPARGKTRQPGPWTIFHDEAVTKETITGVRGSGPIRIRRGDPGRTSLERCGCSCRQSGGLNVPSKTEGGWSGSLPGVEENPERTDQVSRAERSGRFCRNQVQDGK